MQLKGYCERDPEKPSPSSGEVAEWVACGGYLNGFLDGVYVGTKMSSEPKSVCLPFNITVRQLHLMFLKFAGEHPELLHEDAAAMLARILLTAFPCEAKKR
jgi:hypothetical protein